MACLNLLVKLGMPRENIWVPTWPAWSTKAARELMDEDKAFFAQKTSQRTLAEAIVGADVFLGLSAGGVIKKRWSRRWRKARSSSRSPTRRPEIMPGGQGGARRRRSSPPAAPTIRTRSTTSCASPTSSAARSTAAPPRSPTMEIAAVHAIAELAQAEQSEVVAAAYMPARR